MPNKEKFLKEVISQVNFKYDRYDIKKELEAHIIDKTEYYIDQGYSSEEAEEMSLNDMGDAKEIGKELNKQHNPVLGWIWRISNTLLVLFVIVNVFIVGIHLLGSIYTITFKPTSGINKSNITYRLDVNEKVKVDDTVVHITDIIYENNGDLSIVYKDYDTRLWGVGWSFGSLGEVSDNLGNTYHSSSGMSSGGIVTKSIRTIRNFSKEADTLIITYDYYNRYYRLEIPLKAGE